MSHECGSTSLNSSHTYRDSCACSARHRWDALATVPDAADDDEEEKIVKPAGKKPSTASTTTVGKGSVWRVQAHAKSSISCLRVEPVAGKDVRHKPSNVRSI